MKGHFLGIEIGGSKLQLIVTDNNFKEAAFFSFAVDKENGAAGIRSIIESTIKEIQQSYTIAKIGVGFGGPIDRVTGRIFTSYHIEGWTNFSITDWLKDISQCPVTIDNDGNVAALGEATLGAGRNYNSVYYVTLGSGVGSGLVMHTQIFHGAPPGETELGHIRLNKQGLTVQDSCSGWAVNEKIIRSASKNPSGFLSKLIAPLKDHQAKILREAIAEGDSQAKEIFDDTMDDLCFALSHAVHLLHPQVIIFGGGLSLMGETLSLAIEKTLPKYLMDAFQPGPVIKLSYLKEKAVPFGAAVLAKTSNPY